MILPHIEQQALFQQIAFSDSMVDPKTLNSSAAYAVMTISATHRNVLAAKAKISTYLCPSDSVLDTSAMGSGFPARFLHWQHRLDS